MNKFKHFCIGLASLLPLTSFGNNAQAQFDPIITQPQLPPPINAPAMSIEQQMRNRIEHQRVTPGSNTVTPSPTVNRKLANAYVEEGFEYYQRGEYKRAVSAYNLALSYNSSFAIAYLGRAMALRKLGDKRNAFLDARRASHWSRQQGNMKVLNAAENFKRVIYR